MKKNYWSCTKFANWLRGTPKPYAASAEEWIAWEEKAKKKKIRYWLAEEGLDHLQSILFFPAARLRELRSYISNRWLDKTHALTSTLKKGQYYELDTRLLHAIFDELVNFVEIGLAWKNLICLEKNEQKQYKFTWYRRVFRIGRWRNVEAGIDYLNWAASLKYDEDWRTEKEDPKYGTPTAQALAAQETLALYHWWKEKRPNRPDPMDASGWSAYYEKNTNVSRRDKSTWHQLSFYQKKDPKAAELAHACAQLEQQQEDEDTEMLLRLIKIRNCLWT